MTGEHFAVAENEVEELDPADTKALDKALGGKAGRKVKGLKGGAARKRVFVVHSDDPFVSEALQSIILRLPGIVRARRKEMTNQELDALVDLLMPDDPVRGVLRDIEIDNVKLRERFLKEWPCLKSPEVHQLSGAKGRNESLTASRWKRTGKIFAISVGRKDLYPAFQLQDGKPHPTVARVLAIFSGRLSPWQIAFWFVAENGWLDGARPVDLLDEPDTLMKAATREVEEPRH